jgi:ketosteroid isomerase-like protein
VVRTFYQNYRDRDFNSLAQWLADDVDFSIEISTDYFPFAGPKRGRDPTVASLKELVGSIEHLQYDEVFTIADGVRACVFIHCRVRDRATRAESEVDLCDLLELQDGKICWFREFLDTLSATEQMMGKRASFA